MSLKLKFATAAAYVGAVAIVVGVAAFGVVLPVVISVGFWSCLVGFGNAALHVGFGSPWLGFTKTVCSGACVALMTYAVKKAR